MLLSALEIKGSISIAIFFSYHLTYALSISFYSEMFVTLPVYFSSFFNGGFENVGRGPASTRVAILQAPSVEDRPFFSEVFLFLQKTKTPKQFLFSLSLLI